MRRPTKSNAVLRAPASAGGSSSLLPGVLALFGTLACDVSQAERAAAAAAIERPQASAAASAQTEKKASAAAAAQTAQQASSSLSATPTPPHAPPSSVAASDEPRVYAKTRFVWVRPEPDASRSWIGFLWTGSSVRLKSTAARSGPGCATFYEIEPQGFVCVDGKRATLDRDDPVYRAVEPYAAKRDSAHPHRYAESRGAARYFAEPTPSEQARRENDLTAHWRAVEAARAGNVGASLLGVDLSLPEQGPIVFPELPKTIFEDRRRLLARSTVAYSAEARFGDRAFLLGADYAWIPKDRVVSYPVVAFRGVPLEGENALPLAFFRGKDRPQYLKLEDASFEPSGGSFARLSHVQLTGETGSWEGVRYLQVRGDNLWVRESDAVVPKPRGTTPWGAPLGPGDTAGGAPKGRGTWVEISIEGGWLLAFEGTRAVYATLVSPGRGGAAKADEDPLERSATPTGRFPISGKFVTATMEAPGELVHSDVPFAQNLVGPYAIHGAYWHDNWGKPQSGGCVNLSPTDAKWLFEFSEPKLPEGWHGVRWLPWQGPATVVLLHR